MEEKFLKVHLFLSIIRQESEFDLSANSHAGAQRFDATNALYSKISC